MPIKFNCHVCGKLLRTADEKAGKTAKCPGCGEKLTVPGSETEPDNEFGDDEYGDGGADDYGDDDYGDEDEFAPAPSGGAKRNCPMCGESISRKSARCEYCGEKVGGGRSKRRRSSYSQPHRGAMILTFGILSFCVCFIFAIVAWVMANTDLQEMQAGRMDPEGEGLTKAGKIISMVSLGLMAAGMLGYCFIVIFFAAIGAM